MINGLRIKRTNSADPDFQKLIMHLDHELWNELQEDQATYDQYNKIPDLQTTLVLYINDKPAAIGCFKKYNGDTVEIKRMFVEKEFRRKGLSNIVLKELEDWAIESGYKYAILETSIHFKATRTLYSHAGYKVIDNYDQYAGLEESVCMKKYLVAVKPSEFKRMNGIEYFDFEEGFIEENVRCIPMIVRFKMDLAGVKLKLAEWSKFNIDERKELAVKSCNTVDEITAYNNYLKRLVEKYTGKPATEMEVDKDTTWEKNDIVPGMLNQKAKEFDWNISVDEWRQLTKLQRFALLKLCRPGHENKNFPKAMKEFKIVK